MPYRHMCRRCKPDRPSAKKPRLSRLRMNAGLRCTLSLSSGSEYPRALTHLSAFRRSLHMFTCVRYSQVQIVLPARAACDRLIATVACRTDATIEFAFIVEHYFLRVIPETRPLESGTPTAFQLSAYISSAKPGRSHHRYLFPPLSSPSSSSLFDSTR